MTTAPQDNPVAQYPSVVVGSADHDRMVTKGVAAMSSPPSLMWRFSLASEKLDDDNITQRALRMLALCRMILEREMMTFTALYTLAFARDRLYSHDAYEE